MKKILILVGLLFWLSSCDKESLDTINPNAPGVPSLKTEDGFVKAAYGVYGPLQFTNNFYFTWFNQWAHNIMGDVTLSSVGNFGIRWANQPAKIIRPSGVIVTPPVGGTQVVELNNRNTRSVGTDNVQAFEWVPLYGLIGHCNLLLATIDEVQFTGDQATIDMKKKTYRSWLYWWKGFAYSRIGSIYKQALIVNEYKEINTNYVSNTAILAEAAVNFNLAKDILATISETDAVYLAVFNKLLPSHFKGGKFGGIITPEMFIRNINSYLARNILVNKYATDLTTADLTAIETLANSGLRATDKTFTVRSASTNCFVYETTWTPYRLNITWEMLSERLYQDVRDGDARKTRNFVERPTWQLNPAARGFNYSTRWNARSIGTGGDWKSDVAGEAEMTMATSYEENQLMLAEAKIRKDDIDGGLAHLDNVRTFQNSGLPATVGTGLTKAQALEELRSERRVGLFLRGTTAFYDARRWGVLKPLAQGGGRKNAIVVFAQTPTPIIEECEIEYDYKEWWDVPANETDFNPITTGSAFDPSGIRPL